MQLPMQLIDAHCHLEHEAFAGDVAEVVKRARGAGVAKAVCAGGSLRDNEAILRLRRQFPGFVEGVVGLAPHFALQEGVGEHAEFIRTHSHEIVGIGEIGLDQHHFTPEQLPALESAFRAQLELAEELALPVVVHSRKAERRVFGILGEFPKAKVMLHCFYQQKLAAEAVGKGWLVSLPTLKSSASQKIAREAPLSSLAAETDAPFLWQEDGRPARNECANVASVYAMVAGQKHARPEEVAAGINAAVCRFFGFEV
ncbi:TatD family hydrolase [Candidatus Micrarchaeota archaeon]|nr:TatD family hydrolase [Candidatus Micrarchaeota archaeon]